MSPARRKTGPLPEESAPRRAGDFLPRPNAAVSFLASFCRSHRLDEKILVVPSFSIGHQIGQALAGAGEAWVNLRFVTLLALAHETAAARLARDGRQFFAERRLIVFVDALFRELKEAGAFAYFGRMRARPGLMRALLGALRALRLAGMSSATLEAGRLCVESKGLDIARLFERYEDGLGALNALDSAGLYEAARRSAAEEVRPVPARDRGWYLCLENLSLARLERDFLEALAGDRLVLVPRDPVFGLEHPRGRIGGAGAAGSRSRDRASVAASDVERLAWLFDPAGSPEPIGDGAVEFFRAAGQANECREVVRRIQSEGLSFDEAEAVAPPGSVYPRLFHVLGVRCGIPITFADGLPLFFTAPGRVFFGLLDWIEGRFPVSGLCRLIESGDLAIPPDDGGADVPAERIGRFLRNARIGWGRDRYLERLEACRLKLEADIREPSRDGAEAEAPGRAAELRRSVLEAGRLAAALRTLLGLLPAVEPGVEVDFAGLCSGLSSILAGFARVGPGPAGLDGQALVLLTTELNRLGAEDRALAGAVSPAALSLRLEDALERLRSAAGSLTAGASSPLPGHLHVSSFAAGGYSGRRMTFVVGLNDSAVPGPGLQDPILLDAEREAISEFLPTTADTLKAGLHSLAALLASLRGRVVLSYSSYDIMEERRLYPSSVILQGLRLVRGDADLDYSDLDRAFRADAARAARLDPAGFIPDNPAKAIDERDWWFRRLFRDGRFLDGLEAVGACFPALRNGFAADEARQGETLTAHDGLVEVDRDRLDPLRNHGLVMSASRLELLAKCPYGYFLRYVLRIEPPRDLELDRGRWLDPLQRGSLVHRVLFAFMSEVTKRGERVSAAAHASLLDGIAAEVVGEYRRDVPPPSEGIFDKERSDILETLAIFLRIESDRDPRVVPVAFEKSFEDVAVGAGRSGWFKLRGVIDRVDRTGPGTYRIVDYKTGSYRDYEGFEAFAGGRRIQHALYALAAEKILADPVVGPAPRVTESGYFFPTRRGEGREIMVKMFDRDKLRELLADLLGLVGAGYFVTTTRDDCGYCDFVSVCGGASDNTKRKLASNPAVSEALDRLKRYA